MGKVPDSFWDWEKDPLTPRHLDHLKKWELERETQVRDLMRAVRRQFVDIGMPEYSTMISIQKVKEGIARDLLNEAQRGYDAVLVGRGGIRDAGGQLIGSVAAKMAAKLGSANLWLVGKKPIKGRILIALDRSDCAIRAVRHVGGMINTSNHVIELLHVVRGISVSAAGNEKIFPEEYRQRLLEEAENAMKPTFQAARSRLYDAGIPPERLSSRLLTGVSSRSGAIVEEARQGGFGTIVLGRRGLSGGDEHAVGRVGRQICHLVCDRAVWIVG